MSTRLQGPHALRKTEARLRETPDGCVLLGRDDQVIFQASGRGARTQCLQRAAAAGVLRIMH